MKNKRVHCPGIEPGSTAWKATILAARLTMLDSLAKPSTKYSTIFITYDIYP